MKEEKEIVNDDEIDLGLDDDIQDVPQVSKQPEVETKQI